MLSGGRVALSSCSPAIFLKANHLKSQAMTTLAKPLEVAPLIKLTRWSLLVCGYFYGISKMKFYRVYDRNLKIKRQKIIEDSNTEKRRISTEQFIDVTKFLGGIVGMEFPPGWKPPFIK